MILHFAKHSRGDLGERVGRGLIKTRRSGSGQGFRGARFYCRKSITLPEMLDAFRYFLSGQDTVRVEGITRSRVSPRLGYVIHV